MALDFILVGLSILILVLYITVFLLLILINRRLEGSVKVTFVLLMIGTILLVLRRVEYLFSQSDIISIPYFRDAMSLLFAMILFFATFNFYKNIIGLTGKKNYRNPIDKYRGRRYYA